MNRFALFGVGVTMTLMVAAPARAIDRMPVAVVWMGDAASLEERGARRTVDEVNAALGRTRTARPIDGVEDRRTLVDGGPATHVQLLLRRAEQSFVKLKYADAARDYEAAEQLLLDEVPFEVMRATLGDVERNLLASYDQLGRGADASRAAERLSWTAGSNEDMQRLVDKYRVSRAWEPARPPITVETEPPGALVYRDLRELGPAPQTTPGGDAALDVVDVEAPGFRRAHRELGAASMKVALVKEDRLGVLVDHIRAQAPDAQPKDVAAVGRRVGAARVLVLLPDGPKKLLGRWLDVDHAAWAPESARVDGSGAPAMEKLALYVAPKEPAGPPPGAVVAAAPVVEKKSRLGAWGKWYTWVAAGGVVALIVTILVVQKVGNDSLTVTATH